MSFFSSVCFSAKQDNWFDFNSGAAGSAVQESGSAGDAWSSVFSTPAAVTTASVTTDVWGASDPFAKQPLGKLRSSEVTGASGVIQWGHGICQIRCVIQAALNWLGLLDDWDHASIG